MTKSWTPESEMSKLELDDEDFPIWKTNNDAYRYSQHVAKRILFYLKKFDNKTFPYLIFRSKVMHWIELFQVKKDYKRATFFAAYIAFYKMQMTSEHEKKLLEDYPE